MLGQDNGSYGIPFPAPISPNMPMSQQLSMDSLYPGLSKPMMNTPNYNFQPASYSHGGHISSLAEALRTKGQDEDQILAHINPEEAEELGHHFGYDINPHTGLPQFGFFKKMRKAVSKAVHHSGLSKVLPVAGAIAGNFIAPGIGGLIGGGIGGALSGKKPLKGALMGSAIGAAQGYGFPALGKLLSSQGMPHLGQAFTHLGASKLGPGLSSLGAGLGLTSPAAATAAGAASSSKGLGTTAAIGTGLGLGKIASQGEKKLKMAEQEAENISSGQESSSEGLGLSNILGSKSLLDYLLLGATGAGILGGKTKYKIPKEDRNEPSFEDVLEKMQNYKKKDRPYVPADPYEPPEWYSDVSGMEEHGYDYPQIRSQDYRTFRPNFMNEPPMAYKKGGHVKKFGKGGMMNNRLAGVHQGMTNKLAAANQGISNRLAVANQGIVPNRSASIRQKSYNELAKAAQPTPSPTAVPSPAPEKSISSSPSYNFSSSRSSPPRIRHKSYNDLEREELEKDAYRAIAQSHVPQGMPENVEQLGLYKSLIPGLEIPDNLLSHILSSSMKGHGSAQDRMMELIEMGRDMAYKPGRESDSRLGKDNDYYQMFKKIPAYEPPEWYSDVSGMEEHGHPYQRFNKGGYVEGDDGGQDDNVPADLPEGSYIVDATTVSMIGDGNSQAGAKKLAHLLSKYENHYAAGAHVHGHSGKVVPALISEGEYKIDPHVVAAIGDGDNKRGATRIKSMINKIRKHKGVKRLPPKSKPLESYLRA